MTHLARFVYRSMDITCRLSGHWHACWLLNNTGPLGRLWAWALMNG
jgi:hypothetical protein